MFPLAEVLAVLSVAPLLGFIVSVVLVVLGVVAFAVVHCFVGPVVLEIIVLGCKVFVVSVEVLCFVILSVVGCGVVGGLVDDSVDDSVGGLVDGSVEG